MRKQFTVFMLTVTMVNGIWLALVKGSYQYIYIYILKYILSIKLSNLFKNTYARLNVILFVK